jgi:hypothetical protein
MITWKAFTKCITFYASLGLAPRIVFSSTAIISLFVLLKISYIYEINNSSSCVLSIKENTLPKVSCEAIPLASVINLFKKSIFQLQNCSTLTQVSQPYKLAMKPKIKISSKVCLLL